MQIVPKYILIGVIGVVILSVFLLSSGVVNPSWNPFKPAPSGEVLENAIANLSKEKILKIQGLVEVDIRNVPESIRQKAEQENTGFAFNTINGNLTFSQLIDTSDKLQNKKSTDLNLTVGIEGMSMSLGLTAVGVNKDLFVKLNSLPPFLPEEIQTKDIKDKWFLVDLEKLKVMAGVQEASKPQNESAFLAELQNLIQGKQIFRIKRSFGEETVDSKATNHYFAELNKNEVKILFPKVADLLTRYVPEQNKVQYQQDLQNSLDEVMQNFDLIWQRIGGISFDAWLEIGDNRLKKIKFGKTINNNALNIEVLFGDFGKNFNIQAPENYAPLEDVIPKDWFNEPVSE